MDRSREAPFAPWRGSCLKAKSKYIVVGRRHEKLTGAAGMSTFYLPDFIYTDGRFRAGIGILVGDDGSIVRLGPEGIAAGATVVRMPGKALLPGMVNAHSHTFQRLIRGVAEHRGPNGDDFWAWRNTMYHAASQLDPDDVFAVARMAFLEMALSGITAVGEFHYVHRQPDGTSYDDPNLLAKRVIDAATSVGLRICLLRVAYLRAGYNLPPNPGQRRFYESCDEYLRNAEQLARDLACGESTVSIGAAPHSIRAVTLDALMRIAEWAQERNLPIHIHAAEQTAEISACEREHGAPPIRLLAQCRLLSSRMTLIHAVHTVPDEVNAIAHAGAKICSCPTTERNLGDGIIDADRAIEQGILFCFGSDSQATINLLEDARELDYHLRLKQHRRVLLDGIDGEEMSARLFHYATVGGAASLRLNTGALEPGRPADFFSIDLHDITIAGASPEELLPMVVFSLDRAAVRDVVVAGRAVITDGRHHQADDIIARYRQLASRIASVQV
jgi:formimidoylglutamate deiminase